MASKIISPGPLIITFRGDLPRRKDSVCKTLSPGFNKCKHFCTKFSRNACVRHSESRNGFLHMFGRSTASGN